MATRNRTSGQRGVHTGLVCAVVLSAWVAVALSPLGRAGAVAEPASGSSAGNACRDGAAPYAADSAWNSPIEQDAALDPASTAYIDRLASLNKPLSSDPDQYTIPVHCVEAGTTKHTVKLSGFFSDYSSGERVGHGHAPTISDVPIPDDAVGGVGSDGQVVIWDADAGLEYGFWQLRRHDGQIRATNGYLIRTDATSSGRFADGKAGRGAGLPYLAGLVRPQEVEAGRIEHALAFAYKYPAKQFVFPASKSDGLGQAGRDLPEGSRIQLDPTLTDLQLADRGVTGDAALTIAHALQEYGMYVVDNSGSSKIYLEERTTAGWSADITRDTVSALDWKDFRVVAPDATRSR